MGDKLNLLDDKSWSNISKIIIFGYGRSGKKIFPILQKDFEIVAIVENDMSKVGQIIDGVSVLSFKEAVSLMKKYRTVITTQAYFYQEISKQLQEAGLEENIDFVTWKQFLVEWYYKYCKKICIEKTDVFITPFCSLKCEKCVFFTPYWRDKLDMDVHKVMSDVDSYFSCVDYVFDMQIVGGEPLLHRQLSQILEYIGSKYRKQIGFLGIITNGTIIPNKEVLDVLKKYDIWVSISDYTEEVKYDGKIDAVCDALKAAEVLFIRNRNIKWFDFGFPKPTVCYDGEKAEAHMKECNTVCHTLSDGKFYYCAVDYAAQKSGLFKESKSSYLDLSQIDTNSVEDRSQILRYDLGEIEGGVLPLCKVCGGFGKDNQNVIPTAKQL